jgi:glycerol-3-phosphate acyltransferase PlsY
MVSRFGGPSTSLAPVPNPGYDSFMAAGTAYFLLPLASYLLGSVPFGYLLVRAVRGIDVRTVGSGNVGATNVTRALGLRWGVVAFLLDFGKGLVPAEAFSRIAHQGLVPHRSLLVLALVYGGFAIAGHLYPVYLRFQGGKGVATSAGVLAGAATFPVILAGFVWAVALAVTRRVSAASMIAAVCLPPIALGVVMRTPALRDKVLLVAFCSLVSAMVLWRHRSNLRRILDGTEPRIGEGDVS